MRGRRDEVSGPNKRGEYPLAYLNSGALDYRPQQEALYGSKGKGTADDEQLSATQAYGVIPQKISRARRQEGGPHNATPGQASAVVERDDFVISMRSFQGGLERAWAAGCIRSSYVVLKPSPEARVDYFAHLFKSLDYIRALQATSNFIRDGQDQISGTFAWSICHFRQRTNKRRSLGFWTTRTGISTASSAPSGS